MSKVEISKVKISIGKKEIELSLDEARELQQILNETFGKEETRFIPYPSSPIIIERPYRRCWPHWYVDWTSPTTISAVGSGDVQGWDNGATMTLTASGN